MNTITRYAANLTSQMSHISPSAIPSTLWHYYVRYLWKYSPDSSVAKIAYTFRLLAIIVIMPVVFLILLDVSAYVLARTLGVVEDVKASTSDNKAHAEMDQAPAIVVHAPPPAANSDATAELSSSPELDSRPPVFYAGADDFRLSGADVFSPMAESTPPSPVAARGQVQSDEKDHVRQRNQYQTESES